MTRRRSNLLAGVQIIDAASMLAGPYAAMVLASMGADVVKVEPPQGDPARYSFGPPFVFGDSTYFQAVNQDKRSVMLDLQKPETRSEMSALIERSDVIIHNLRDGPARKLGLAEEDVRRHRPDIVYAHVSGFGSVGPWCDRPGMDLIFQGLSGLMSVTGSPEGPPVRAGAQVVDLAAGVYLASAVAAALFRRRGTGEGERVEVTLLDVGFALQNTLFSHFFATGVQPERVGSGSHVSITNCFATEDAWLNVSVAHDRHWRDLCTVLERKDLLDDPRFATNPRRVELRREIEAELRAVFVSRTTDDWLERLDGIGVPCGPVLSFADAVAQPQVMQNDTVMTLDHPAGQIDGVMVPIRCAREGSRTHTAPPPLGQHNREILAELGVEPLVDHGSGGPDLGAVPQ